MDDHLFLFFILVTEDLILHLYLRISFGNEDMKDDIVISRNRRKFKIKGFYEMNLIQFNLSDFIEIIPDITMKKNRIIYILGALQT